MEGTLGGLFFLILFPAALVLAIVLALVWQRKAMNTQQRAMSHVEESLALSRRSVELQEQVAVMAEESLRNQREMLELLRRLLDSR
jgi:H+/Cl- antiporter ClcA